MVSQADIDALNQAIADGVRQVTIGGQTVTYNTTDSLIRARNDLLEQMRQDEVKAGATPVRRRAYAYYSGRGYE